MSFISVFVHVNCLSFVTSNPVKYSCFFARDFVCVCDVLISSISHYLSCSMMSKYFEWGQDTKLSCCKHQREKFFFFAAMWEKRHFCDSWKYLSKKSQKHNESRFFGKCAVNWCTLLQITRCVETRQSAWYTMMIVFCYQLSFI